jgi:hypothetical protein
MSITARISANEVSAQVTERFVGKHCEARLINSPGTNYTPGTTDDVLFLSDEVTLGTGGYTREVISIAQSDVSNYTDGGIGLTQKATVFAHDNGATAINFSHVALVWSAGNVESVGTVTAAPASGQDGTYEGIPISSTDGSGVGMTIDLTIINGGLATTDYAIAIRKPGYGYAPGDTLTINNGVLAGLFTAGAGDLEFSVGTASTNTEAGNVLAVAKTTSGVSLTAGNEAVFYWNLKLFGFFS